jgi:hypothetical protein
MTDYTPTWAGGVPDVDTTPEDERYGDGVTHDHEAAHMTDAAEDGGGETAVRTGPPTFGEKRHPSIITIAASFDVHSLHKCGGRWVAAGRFEDRPVCALDADRDGAEVFTSVYGTRKGDTWTGEVSVRKLEHDGEEWRAVIVFPEEEIGALWRWNATGCLVCGGDAR